MARVPLRETVYINFTAGGAGTAKSGPISARETWYPDVASVKANAGSVTNESTCIISTGDVNTKNFRDSTVNGSSGDASDRVSGDVIKCGQFVWADWTGGDASVQAQLTVTGTKEV